MNLKEHALFISSIHEKRMLLITFFSKLDDECVTRTVAPMDFGPRKNDERQIDKYHFWDFTGQSRPHPESLEPDQIISISQAEDSFDPASFVEWDPTWHVQRDWGDFS